jgi:hypothetical protein
MEPFQSASQPADWLTGKPTCRLADLSAFFHAVMLTCFHANLSEIMTMTSSAIRTFGVASECTRSGGRRF